MRQPPLNFKPKVIAIQFAFEVAILALFIATRFIADAANPPSSSFLSSSSIFCCFDYENEDEDQSAKNHIVEYMKCF